MEDSLVDVYEEEGCLFVEVSLPGVELPGLSVNACGSRLLIWAVRPPASAERRYRMRGRSRPEICRPELVLPPEARLDRAAATLSHGILRVRVPMAQREPSRAIRPLPVTEGAGAGEADAVMPVGGPHAESSDDEPRVASGVAPRKERSARSV